MLPILRGHLGRVLPFRVAWAVCDRSWKPPARDTCARSRGDGAGVRRIVRAATGCAWSQPCGVGTRCGSHRPRSSALRTGGGRLREHRGCVTPPATPVLGPGLLADGSSTIERREPVIVPGREPTGVGVTGHALKPASAVPCSHELPCRQTLTVVGGRFREGTQAILSCAAERRG